MKNGINETSNEFDAEIKKLEQTIRQTPPEDVAYAILVSFSRIAAPTEELTGMFGSWLADRRGSEAKDKALKRFFDEIDAGREAETEEIPEKYRPVQISPGFTFQ